MVVEERTMHGGRLCEDDGAAGVVGREPAGQGAGFEPQLGCGQETVDRSLDRAVDAGEAEPTDRRGRIDIDGEPVLEQRHARRGSGDGRRHRAHGVHRRRERLDALERDASVGGLEADDAAARRRCPDRSAGVGPQPDVDLAPSDGDGRSGRRPTGDAGRVERVGRRTGVLVDAAAAERQLVEVGLADDAAAVAADRSDADRVFRRRRGLLGHRPACRGRRRPSHVDEVLDRHGRPIAVRRIEPEQEGGHPPSTVALRLRRLIFQIRFRIRPPTTPPIRPPIHHGKTSRSLHTNRVRPPRTLDKREDALRR